MAHVYTTEELMDKDGLLTVLDLNSGEVHHWDVYAIRERGVPENMMVMRDMTRADWMNAISRAMHR